MLRFLVLCVVVALVVGQHTESNRADMKDKVVANNTSAPNTSPMVTAQDETTLPAPTSTAEPPVTNTTTVAPSSADIMHLCTSLAVAGLAASATFNLS